MYAFKNSSLTKEQLTSLGVTSSKDALQQQQAPPLFPLTSSKPIEIKYSTKLEFIHIFQESFRSRLFEIHSNNNEVVSADSFSSKVAVALEKEHKKNLQFKFAWHQMPAELRPQARIKRKCQQSSKVKPNLKSAKVEKIDEKLQKLEEKEERTGADDDKSDKDSDQEIDDDEEIEPNEDAELDNETDYINNYFDNGEGYMDEDDALDDGPVY